MAMPDAARLLPLAESIADGSDVDWAAAEVPVNGGQTVYAANATGAFTGSDTALPNRGFVFTPGSHYTWLTSNAYTVLPQRVSTLTLTLKSDGDMPLTISSVRASALRGGASVAGTTCGD